MSERAITIFEILTQYLPTYLRKSSELCGAVHRKSQAVILRSTMQLFQELHKYLNYSNRASFVSTIALPCPDSQLRQFVRGNGGIDRGHRHDTIATRQEVAATP